MKVLVIGDVIIDKYVYGTSSRISTEAPVPVITYIEEKETLGGAGLVYENLKNLDVDVTLFEIDQPRSVKTRIMCDGHYITRIDDDKDADFLFGQINQPSFKADGNKFMKDLSKKYLKKYNAIQGGVPSAPFVTDRNKWTGLAIKRLLKLADEGGYDAIAFSPGKVQYDRWGKLSLVDYYNKIIPQVASKLPKSLGITTEKINIPIPTGKTLSIAEDSSSGKFYIYDETGNVDIAENKFFDTKEEAREFIKNNLDILQKEQETFAINVTPKMQEKVRSGIPLFSATGGALGLGATMNNEDYGALSNMPSTQANAT